MHIKSKGLYPGYSKSFYHITKKGTEKNIDKEYEH